MFNRYWRSYPWVLQMVLLILMVFTMVWFATLVALLVLPWVSGVATTALVHVTAASSPAIIRASLLTQAIGHAGMFLIPAWLFAACSHPRVREYLGLRLPGKPVHWLLITGMMLGLIPVFQWGETWTLAHLHFGATADKLQQENSDIISAYMSLGRPADLLLLLFTLALLPALGEELLFRGVLLRMLHNRSRSFALKAAAGNNPLAQDPQRSMVTPVIITALMFSAIHTNAYGFLFIFIAGCVLALIYFLTGSLLCSIWAHMLYNGTQVALEYYSHHSTTIAHLAEVTPQQPIFPLAGVALFAISFYGLIKTQTPMRANWSDNFKEESNPARSI